MFFNLGPRKCAGLTDHPEKCMHEHGNPADWEVVGPFQEEWLARSWERNMVSCGYRPIRTGDGWRYGYTFGRREEDLSEARRHLQLRPHRCG